MENKLIVPQDVYNRIEADALAWSENQYGHDDVNKDYLEGALHEAMIAQAEYVRLKAQPGPRWVKCSDRMPEISKPPKLLTVKRYEAIPEIYSTRAVTAAQLADIVKYDLANFEWLDEQPAAGREEDAVLGILQYISESEFYYNHAEKAWLIKGTHSIKLTHNELIEKYELFKQQHNP